MATGKNAAVKDRVQHYLERGRRERRLDWLQVAADAMAARLPKSYEPRNFDAIGAYYTLKDEIVAVVQSWPRDPG
jgi:hypothetical protein